MTIDNGNTALIYTDPVLERSRSELASTKQPTYAAIVGEGTKLMSGVLDHISCASSLQPVPRVQSLSISLAVHNRAPRSSQKEKASSQRSLLGHPTPGMVSPYMSGHERGDCF